MKLVKGDTVKFVSPFKERWETRFDKILPEIGTVEIWYDTNQTGWVTTENGRVFIGKDCVKVML